MTGGNNGPQLPHNCAFLFWTSLRQEIADLVFFRWNSLETLSLALYSNKRHAVKDYARQSVRADRLLLICILSYAECSLRYFVCRNIRY